MKDSRQPQRKGTQLRTQVCRKNPENKRIWCPKTRKQCAAEALGVQADVLGKTHGKQPAHSGTALPLSLNL